MQASDRYTGRSPAGFLSVLQNAPRPVAELAPTMASVLSLVQFISFGDFVSTTSHH